MNGALSQLVSLCSAANGIIADRIDLGAFYPSNAEFTFCNSVRFVEAKVGLRRKPREVLRHGDPNDWLRSLRKSTETRAWLSFSGTENPRAPDHQMAGFVGGGGDWKLNVTANGFTESWMSRWEVTNRNTKNNRIWGVTYVCSDTPSRVTRIPLPDLALVTKRLHSTLYQARQFAAMHSYDTWAKKFSKALDCLEPTTRVTFPEYVQFVCLDAYPEAAQRLFSAAFTGWVFGGMGSWNDLGFDSASERDRYDKISTELYTAINDAIQQSTWSFIQQKTT